MTWAVCWTWENLGLERKVGVSFYDANTAPEAISICIYLFIQFLYLMVIFICLKRMRD